MKSTGTTLFHRIILAKRVLLFEAKELLHADATMLWKSYQRFISNYCLLHFLQHLHSLQSTSHYSLKDWRVTLMADERPHQGFILNVTITKSVTFSCHNMNTKPDQNCTQLGRTARRQTHSKLHHWYYALEVYASQSIF